MLKGVVFVVGALSALGACVAIQSVTSAGPPKAYVGLFKEDAVAVIDTVQNKVLTRVPVADGRLAFVTNEGSNDVSVVDVESRTVAATIAVGNAPRKIAMQPISGTDATTETTVRTNTARAETGKSLVIDGVSYANHGTKDARNLSKLELEADDYYFSPTFLRGKPGQKLTLLVESEARTPHNLSISSLGIDKDIPPKGKVRLEVTFPASGVLAFTCKFHAGSV